MPTKAKNEPRKEPEHEDVVATLLGMQAKLRGESARTQLPHFVEAPEAAAVAVREPHVVILPEATPARGAKVVRLPEAAPPGPKDVQRRLASIQERLDLLEEGLTSLMIQIEDRGKS